MECPWPSASSAKGNPPALGKHVPKASIHINIHIHSPWNSASLQTSVQSGEKSGQKSKQAGKSTTFFSMELNLEGICCPCCLIPTEKTVLNSLYISGNIFSSYCYWLCSSIEQAGQSFPILIFIEINSPY